MTRQKSANSATESDRQIPPTPLLANGTSRFLPQGLPRDFGKGREQANWVHSEGGGGVAGKWAGPSAMRGASAHVTGEGGVRRCFLLERAAVVGTGRTKGERNWRDFSSEGETGFPEGTGYSGRLKEATRKVLAAHFLGFVYGASFALLRGF